MQNASSDDESPYERTYSAYSQYAEAHQADRIPVIITITVFISFTVIYSCADNICACRGRGVSSASPRPHVHYQNRRTSSRRTRTLVRPYRDFTPRNRRDRIMVRPQRMARVRVQDAETGRGYPRRASSVGVGGLWGDIRRGMRAGAVPR